jgi:hypothetical protein
MKKLTLIFVACLVVIALCLYPLFAYEISRELHLNFWVDPARFIQTTVSWWGFWMVNYVFILLFLAIVFTIVILIFLRIKRMKRKI